MRDRPERTVWINDQGKSCCVFCHLPLSTHRKCRRCTALMHTLDLSYDTSLFKTVEPAYVSHDNVVCLGCIDMDMTGREMMIEDEDGACIFRRCIIEKESINDVSTAYRVSVATVIDTIRREASKLGLVGKDDKREIRIMHTRRLYKEREALNSE